MVIFMGTYKRLTKVLVYFHEDYFVPIKFSYDGIKNNRKCCHFFLGGAVEPRKSTIFFRNDDTWSLQSRIRRRFKSGTAILLGLIILKEFPMYPI